MENQIVRNKDNEAETGLQRAVLRFRDFGFRGLLGVSYGCSVHKLIMRSTGTTNGSTMGR